MARRQRGAAAIFVAVGITALLASMLLVVDIGNLYLAQRGLEQQATMAALAGASALCTSASNPALAGSTAATAVVTENQVRKTQAVATMGSNGFLTGSVDTSSGLQVFKPGTPLPGESAAVQVNLGAESTPGIVSSLSDSHQVGLSASAAATQQIFGRFKVGTSLAGLDGVPIGTSIPISLSAAATLAPLADIYAFATLVGEQTPSEDNFVAAGQEVTAATIVVSVRLHLNISVPPLLTAQMPLAIDISIPGGAATLQSITCPSVPSSNSSESNPNAGYTAQMTGSTDVATVKLGTFAGAASSDPPIAKPGLVVLSLASPLLPTTPLVTLTQTSAGPAPLTVGETTEQTFSPVTAFYQVAPTNGLCTDSVSQTNPATTTCFLASDPDGTTNPQTIVSSGLLASTITSLLVGPPGAGFLGSLTPSIVGMPLTATALLSAVSAPLALVGGAVDGLLDPTLAQLHLGLGQTTVTFEAIRHGAPVSQSFVVPATASK